MTNQQHIPNHKFITYSHATNFLFQFYIFLITQINPAPKSFIQFLTRPAHLRFSLIDTATFSYPIPASFFVTQAQSIIASLFCLPVKIET